MQKITELGAGRPPPTIYDLLQFPDPVMYSREYISLFPKVQLDNLRPGDIAVNADGEIVVARGWRDMFFVYKKQGKWQKIGKQQASKLVWHRPVAEYWEGRPTAQPITLGGHDCDNDGIYSSIDQCPYCAEDYDNLCTTDGCPSPYTILKSKQTIPALLIGFSSAAYHPEVLWGTQIGFSIIHKRVSLAFSVGVIHSYYHAKMGASIDGTILLKRYKVWNGSPFINLHASTLNIFYANEPVHPVRFYGVSSGISWDLYSSLGMFVKFNTGILLGLRETKKAYISGARSINQEEYSFTGGLIVRAYLEFW